MYIFYCCVGRAVWDAKIFGIVLWLACNRNPLKCRRSCWVLRSKTHIRQGKVATKSCTRLTDSYVKLYWKKDSKRYQKKDIIHIHWGAGSLPSMVDQEWFVWVCQGCSVLRSACTPCKGIGRQMEKRQQKLHGPRSMAWRNHSCFACSSCTSKFKTFFSWNLTICLKKGDVVFCLRKPIPSPKLTARHWTWAVSQKESSSLPTPKHQFSRVNSLLLSGRVPNHKFADFIARRWFFKGTPTYCFQFPLTTFGGACSRHMTEEWRPGEACLRLLLPQSSQATWKSPLCLATDFCDPSKVEAPIWITCLKIVFFFE